MKPGQAERICLTLFILYDLEKQRRRQMRYQRFGTGIVLRVDRDEEILDCLTQLCRKEELRLASVTGLGAFPDR